MRLSNWLVGLVIIAGLQWSPVSSQAQFTASERQIDPDVGVRFLPPADIAIVNARIVNGEGVEEEVSLLIRDEHIVDVGANIELPADAQTIDFEGDYLYPAFIDAFVEFGRRKLDTNNAHWNASVNPQVEMASLMEPDKDLLSSLRKAGVGIALAAPDSGIFKGQSCLLTTGDKDTSTEILKDRVFQHLRLYPNREVSGYPNSPMGALALARQTLSDAQWYEQAMQAAASDPGTSAPEYDSALGALQALMGGSQSLVIDGANELYALRADRLAREFSLPLVIRGSGREYRQIDALAKTGRKFIVPVDFPDAPELDNDDQVSDATLQELMHWKLAPSNAARLEEAGIEFVFSTDGLEDKSSFMDAVRKAVEAGLDRKIALAAMTTRPAKLLGVEQFAGAIRRGHLANLLRCDGDLFDSDTEIVSTFVRGEEYEHESQKSNASEGLWTVKLERMSLLSLDLKIGGEYEEPTATLGLEGTFDDEKVATPESNEETSEAEEAGDDELPNELPEELPMVDLKNVKLNELAFSGSFEVSKLTDDSAHGIAFLAATAIPQDGETVWVGTIRWPDGDRSPFEAMRKPVESDEAEGDADKDDASDEKEQESAKEETETKLEIAVNYPLGAFGRTSQPDQIEAILFQGATIWTSGPEGILKEADLLIEKGKVSAVGENLVAPDGATVVDVSGKHISPGIIDCHSHMATDGGVNESGQAVTAEVRIADFIDPNDINIYRQLAGGVTTSNILHGSANPIGGQNQVIKLRWGGLDEDLKMKRAPSGIKFALGENVKQSNRGNEYRTRYPQTRMGVEQIMRDRFEAAKLYRQQWSEWSSSPRGLPPRRDYELEAIAEILEGERWVHCHSYRQDEILACMRVLEDYGVTIGTFQHILEGYKVADAMAKHGAMGSSFSDWWAYKFEVFDAIPHNGAIMHNAGVVVSFNSDDRELARHLNHEAAKAVKYGGVSEAEALKFVTLNPAKQLRIDQYTGSLEVGKDADFVVWSRSPLSTMSACLETWVDGKKYFDRKQDLEDQKYFEEMRLALIQEVIDTGAKTGSRTDEDPSMWWARHDEFCHHFDGHDHDHEGGEEHSHE
ncbi:MAG: amidohydrolase family protein [Aureliella sp.]